MSTEGELFGIGEGGMGGTGEGNDKWILSKNIIHLKKGIIMNAPLYTVTYTSI